MSVGTAATQRTFPLGGYDVVVRSDLQEVLGDLDALYPCAPARPRSAPTRPTIDIEVRSQRRSWTGRRRYALISGGTTINTDLRPEEVLPYLEWGINWRLITATTRHLVVHAASVVFEGRGVILVGPSGAGKSTLAAGLIRRGWTYLCDEFALIDPATTHVLPFPKAICIKAGAFDVMRELCFPLAAGRRHVKALKGTVGYISAIDASVRVAPPAPASAVVFLSHTGHAEPALATMTRGRTAFVLLAHALNRGEFGTGAAAVVERVVRRARCFTLDSGDLHATGALLEAAVSTESGAGVKGRFRP